MNKSSLAWPAIFALSLAFTHAPPAYSLSPDTIGYVEKNPFTGDPEHRDIWISTTLHQLRSANDYRPIVLLQYLHASVSTGPAAFTQVHEIGQLQRDMESASRKIFEKSLSSSPSQSELMSAITKAGAEKLWISEMLSQVQASYNSVVASTPTAEDTAKYTPKFLAELRAQEGARQYARTTLAKIYELAKEHPETIPVIDSILARNVGYSLRNKSNVILERTPIVAQTLRQNKQLAELIRLGTSKSPPEAPRYEATEAKAEVVAAQARAIRGSSKNSAKQIQESYAVAMITGDLFINATRLSSSREAREMGNFVSGSLKIFESARLVKQWQESGPSAGRSLQIANAYLGLASNVMGFFSMLRTEQRPEAIIIEHITRLRDELVGIRREMQESFLITNSNIARIYENLILQGEILNLELSGQRARSSNILDVMNETQRMLGESNLGITKAMAAMAERARRREQRDCNVHSQPGYQKFNDCMTLMSLDIESAQDALGQSAPLSTPLQDFPSFLDPNPKLQINYYKRFGLELGIKLGNPGIGLPIDWEQNSENLLRFTSDIYPRYGRMIPKDIFPAYISAGQQIKKFQTSIFTAVDENNRNIFQKLLALYQQATTAAQNELQKNISHDDTLYSLRKYRGHFSAFGDLSAVANSKEWIHLEEPLLNSKCNLIGIAEKLLRPILPREMRYLAAMGEIEVKICVSQFYPRERLIDRNGIIDFKVYVVEKGEEKLVFILNWRSRASSPGVHYTDLPEPRNMAIREMNQLFPPQLKEDLERFRQIEADAPHSIMRRASGAPTAIVNLANFSHFSYTDGVVPLTYFQTRLKAMQEKAQQEILPNILRAANGPKTAWNLVENIARLIENYAKLAAPNDFFESGAANEFFHGKNSLMGKEAILRRLFNDLSPSGINALNQEIAQLPAQFEKVQSALQANGGKDRELEEKIARLEILNAHSVSIRPSLSLREAEQLLGQDLAAP